MIKNKLTDFFDVSDYPNHVLFYIDYIVRLLGAKLLMIDRT